MDRDLLFAVSVRDEFQVFLCPADMLTAVAPDQFPGDEGLALDEGIVDRDQAAARSQAVAEIADQGACRIVADVVQDAECYSQIARRDLVGAERIQSAQRK